VSPVDSIFSFSPGAVAAPLGVAVALAAAMLLARGVAAPHLARIGLRNIPRRFLRTLLIVVGLMLATMFVASSLVIDDTISLAVRTVAVYNLGRVDEDVTGGYGPLGLYPREIGFNVMRILAKDPLVEGVAPALVAPGVLVADISSRQVRGGVAAMGMDATESGALGALRDTDTGSRRSPQTLGPSDVYLNQPLASALNARVGDTITLYSIQWPGQRYSYTVRAIVTGGPLGDQPSVVMSLPALQGMMDAGNRINHIYIANIGNGLTGVGFSDRVASDATAALPGFIRVTEVKKDGVDFAVRAQSLFGRILTLYTLFALAIGLLLIFLIFTLLAAERRAELGMARAIGMRRGHVIWMLLFEGSAYDMAAAAMGILSGLGLGVLILKLVSPTLQRIGFPIAFALKPDSMAVAFALGLLFTLLTIGVAAWSISHMTIAAALRDLPEPPMPAPSLLTVARGLIAAPPSVSSYASAAGELVWQLAARGLIPLAAGCWALQQGIGQASALWFAVGLSLLVVGATLVARWVALAITAAVVRRERRLALARLARANLIADRLSALVVGASLALYWSLPFDALVGVFGLPRFTGGIQIFFIAGVMMVFGCVLALAPNLDILLAPLRLIGARLGSIRHVTSIALVYPSQQRFRTGVGLSLFSLTLFTMVVMDCIAASTTRSYDNLPAQAANYDIVGQPLFTPAGGIGAVTSALRRTAPATASALTATGEATPLPLGLIEPGTPTAGWRFYPASMIQGSLLDGVGFTLAARAPGFGSDAAVWQAVRTHPGDVVIDVSALTPTQAAILGLTPSPAPGAAQFIGPPIAAGLPGSSGQESLRAQEAMRSAAFSDVAQWRAGPNPLAMLSLLLSDQNALRDYSLRLSGLALGPGRIAPTTLWATDLRGGAATRLNIVGVVANTRGTTYGLMGSPQTFAPVEQGLPPLGSEYYYFKLAPGADAHAAAYAIGSALIDHGFETTVLQDALLDVNGARVFISRALVGLVGLTLLVGMAALAVSGSRAVVERGQQIGMLRALGFHRAHVQLIFLVESLIVGVAGTSCGLVFGLILCRNIFAVDFFEQYQSGLALVVPWRDLAMIIAAAILASLIAALLPAWRAGAITPADALRYE
jgi:putative ABC transport system permease protein